MKSLGGSTKIIIKVHGEKYEEHFSSFLHYIVNKESRKDEILKLFLGGPMQIVTQSLLSTNLLSKTAQSISSFYF